MLVEIVNLSKRFWPLSFFFFPFFCGDQAFSTSRTGSMMVTSRIDGTYTMRWLYPTGD